jgi:hypothetical protein
MQVVVLVPVLELGLEFFLDFGEVFSSPNIFQILILHFLEDVVEKHHLAFVMVLVCTG